MKHPYLEMGQIVSTHGVRGEVKILPWADSPEFLCQFRHIFIDGAAYRVLRSRVQKTCVLMQLEGIDTVEAAQALRGKTILASREEASLEEGAVFIADLIGLPVQTEDGQELGTVARVLPMPAGDVYVIRGKHEYMIPAVREFIKKIDLDAGQILVRIIEGMRSDEN